MTEYILRFPAPQTHYVEVEATVPIGDRDRIELMMAVWTPGSYLVREFARHVEDLRAETTGGTPLAVTKTRKNRWRIELGAGAPAASSITVRYRVYCREMTVRTNFVDASFALLNGAPTFLTDPTALDRPHRVRVELPEGWSQAISPLPLAADAAPDDAATTFVATSYEQLVDSPLYAGNPTVHSFQVDGIEHRLVNHGEGAIWDGPASAEDSRRILEQMARFWGRIPYPSYTIFNLLTEAGGGLEHADSTVLMASRFRTRTRKGLLGWRGLVSHEAFHAWNGKRLRPLDLGPFDYENEVHTRELWFVEGATSYYDDLLVHRAGLSSRKEYLEALSRAIERLQTTPGRRSLSVEQASHDAWIKLYRPDENTANTAISYYTKGAVIAWLLDAEIRRATAGARTLDDLMRRAYDRYSGERGYRREDLRRLAEDVAGTDLTSFFETALESTDELPFEEALDYFGLRFAVPSKRTDDAADEAADDETPAWLGAVTKLDAGLLVVSRVPRETPAHAAGLNAGDELVAVDGIRITPNRWAERLQAYRPGDAAELLISRRDEILTLPITFGREPADAWGLEIQPEASDEQTRRLDAWLGEEPTTEP